MLKGTNVTIRPIEKGDFELCYSWTQDQNCLGNFMDMEMIYKDKFLEVVGSNTTLEIGMFIAEESSRGKGVGTECIKLFVDYLFKIKNIMRIQYTTKTDNIGTKIIGEKMGFEVEGILKKYKFVEGDFRDFYLMAIIRDNWKL